MSKNKKNESGFGALGLGGFVFSTNPDFVPEQQEEEIEEVTPNLNQALRVWKERGRGGKESTVVKGFVGSDEKLEDLAKLIKSKCACGGAAKEGNIIVQGDHRDKIIKMLTDLGYKNVKKAGG
jgi:translation initiation factor 1